MSLPYPYLLKGNLQQDVYNLHSYLNALVREFENSSNQALEPALEGKAPSDVDYVISSANADVPNARLLDDTSTVEFDLTVDNIVTANVPDDGITTVKIADSNVTEDKIADDAVTTPKIIDDAITTDKITDYAITSIKILDSAVDYSKIQDVTAARLLGRDSTSDGEVNEISTGATVFVNSTLLLDSGTYTPTYTNVLNVSANTAYSAQWLRVGNVVTVSGLVIADPTTTGLLTSVGISLPIASTFTLGDQCGGTAVSPTIAGQCAAVVAVGTIAEMRWTAVDVTAQPMWYTFTYRIL